MNETVSSLLSQGLLMTVFGMSLVFAALALLWGLMRLLTTLFRAETEGLPAAPALAAENAAPDPQAEQLTAERARVAALVAGALLSNALPLGLEPPVGPTFEHGRSASSWVAGNRSHALQRWTPPRRPESPPLPSNNY